MVQKITLEINRSTPIDETNLNIIYLNQIQYKQIQPKHNELYEINNLKLICQLKLSLDNEILISKNLFNELFNNNEISDIQLQLIKVDQLTPLHQIELTIISNFTSSQFSPIEIIWNFKRLYMNQILHLNHSYQIKNYQNELVQIKLGQLKSKLDKSMDYGILIANVQVNLKIHEPSPPTTSPSATCKKLINKVEWEVSLNEHIPGLENYSTIVIDALNQIYQSKSSQGLIIYGTYGIGKTYFCKKLIEHSQLNYNYLDCKSLLNQSLKKSFENLIECFNSKSNQLIVLDDINLICSNQLKEPYNCLNSLLLYLIDSNKSKNIIIGITNSLSSIDNKFLKNSRFEKVIEFKLPQLNQRYEFIQSFLNQNELIEKILSKWSINQIELIQELSEKTHGFSLSDLLNLFNTFILLISNNEESDKNPLAILKECLIKWNQPNQYDKFHIKIPEVHLNECYGLDQEIQFIKELIQTPLNFNQLSNQLHLSIPKGVLLHGISGVGKTRLCYAITNDFNLNYIFIESTQLKSKKVGESEKNIQKLFQQCRQLSPCLLIIDQIDGLLSKRSEMNNENYQNRLINTFLSEMDGLFSGPNDDPNKSIIIIATTNDLNRLDSALLRPGRLDIHLELKLPNVQQREFFIKSKLLKIPHQLTDDQIQNLIELSRGFSGSDINQWIQEACFNRLNIDLNSNHILYEDFINCINKFQ